MRLPQKNGRIDKKRTENQIIEAINNGVNFFDTAYRYFGSEEVLGEILSKGYRNKVKISTKIPVDSAKNSDDFYKIFETQLKRLKTNHIDYYLIHSIYSYDEWSFLKKSDFQILLKKKKKKVE